MRRASLVVIASVSWALSISAAQTQPTAPKAVKPSQKKAAPVPAAKKSGESARISDVLSLLDTLYTQAGTSKDQAFKLRTQAQIAEILWGHDTPRGRRFFREVLDALDSMKKEDKSSSGSSAPLPRPPEALLRTEVTGLIARHDRAWADELLRSATRDNNEPQAHDARERAQRVQIAMSAVETDPQFAAEMLAVSAGDQLDASFGALLGAIHAKDPGAANEVFLKTLAGIKGQDSATSFSNLINLAPYCMQTLQGLRPVPGARKDPMQADVIRSFLATAHPVILERIPVLLSELQTTQPGDVEDKAGMTFFMLQMLMPFYDKYLPASAASLRNELTSFTDSLLAKMPKEGNPEGQQAGMQQLREMLDAIGSMVKAADNPSTEGARELVERAEKTSDTEGRMMQYFAAASVMAQTGDVDGALSLADKIPEENQRKALQSKIRLSGAAFAIEHKDWEKATGFLSQETEDSRRLRMYTEIINGLVDSRETQRAAKLLEELEEWASDSEKLATPAVWLNLAELATKVSPERGLQILRATVKLINEKAVPAGGTVSRQGNPELGGAGQQEPRSLSYKPAFSELAKTDYSTTLGIAREIKDAEASLLAQLAACEGALKASTSKQLKWAR